MDSPVSNFIQVLAYIAGPVILGAFILYGVMHSRSARRKGALEALQESETKRLYRTEEEERAAKEHAARQSSNPIDAIERNTDTTG